ncbi:ParB/RepB/Spo0J family partition protein [Paraoerskovia sediminicola]|nr:ParB N-terminal domain-containing protein [Paraoerskovia sediminicola]
MTQPVAQPEVVDVDPRTLVLEANVRADADLDPEFIASIKTHGVLTPVLAVRADDGTLNVRAGQRRTLAAVEAGRETIPAYVVQDAGDPARRIVEQMVENDHRRNVRDSDRTAAFKQLHLLGLTASQIAKQTCTKKNHVSAVLEVANSNAATVQAKYDLTLDQAAILAEFDDDAELVEKLTTITLDDPGNLIHAAQRARDERARAALYAQAETALAADNVRVIDLDDDANSAARCIDYLRQANEGEALTVENHATCPGHAAIIVRHGWNEQMTYEPRYYCTDPTANGHEDRWGSAYAEPKKGPMTDEQKAERREVVENNKAWRSAETVRREWLAQFAKRKTAPKGAAAFIATALAGRAYLIEKESQKSHRLAVDWLNIKTEPYRTAEAIESVVDGSSEARAQHIALVLILGSIEDSTGTHTWRSNGSERAYFTALAAWGYTLSDVEKIAQGDA